MSPTSPTTFLWCHLQFMETSPQDTHTDLRLAGLLLLPWALDRSPPSGSPALNAPSTNAERRWYGLGGGRLLPGSNKENEKQMLAGRSQNGLELKPAPGSL